LPHIPNFSSLIALSVVSGIIFNKKRGLIFPLTAVIISDIVLGLHRLILFTWSSYILIYLISARVKNPNTLKTALLSCTGSVLFFLITNFGVWLEGWYPHTLQGLYECYLRALPFFKNSFFSNLAFSIIFYLGYKLLYLKIFSYLSKFKLVIKEDEL